MPHLSRSPYGSKICPFLVRLFGAAALVGVLLSVTSSSAAPPPAARPAAQAQPVALPATHPAPPVTTTTEASPAVPENPVAAALASSVASAAPETPSAESVAPPVSPVGSAIRAGSSSPEQVTPQLDWLFDRTGSLTLSEVLFPSRQEAFIPYDPLLLPRRAGTVWFRINLASIQTDPSVRVQPPLVLDLNMSITGQIPGTPQVWLVAHGEGGGSLVFPKGEDLFQLPDPLPEQAILYIRTSGLPGPGFAPMLRNANSLTPVDREGLQILLIILGASLFLCLIRGVAERREWRMWAALYVGAVWVQAFWGLPSTPAGVVSLWDMPGLLAPGVALLILPHVGRHLMRTREQAPIMDALLILLALPGIVLSVAPLIPGYVWTLRFLPLWPLIMLLFLPCCLAARIRKLPGAGRFLLICLLPPLSLLGAGLLILFPQTFAPGSFAATLHLENLFQPGNVSLIPLLGLMLSTLLAAFISSPRLPVPSRKGNRASPNTSPSTEKETALNRRGVILELGTPLNEAAGKDLDLLLGASERRGRQDTRNALTETPSRIPPSRTTGEALSLEASELPLPYAATGREGLETKPAQPGRLLSERQRVLPVRMQEPLPLGLVEEALRVPLETLFREISALDQSLLDPETRRHADALGRAGRSLAGVIGNLEQAITQSSRPRSRKEVFDLNQLLLEAHDSVAAQAEAKNLALSWFAAPHLPRRYEGPRAQLAEVLALLVESSVRATERGMVQIRAQRLPESTDPGHLLFTVSDSGKGMPPLTRSSLALVRAWELVGPTGDLVSMDSGPTGSTVSFSIRLTARMADQRAALIDSSPDASANPNTAELLARLPASSLRIIVASSIPGNRQLLAYYLDELPHEILESRSADEVRNLYFRSPGALIIFDDDIPEEAISSVVAAIRAFEGEHSFPLASILALVSEDDRGERLHRAGCTHILMKPVVRTELRHLTLRLAPVPRRYGNTFTEAPVQISGKPTSTRTISVTTKSVPPNAGTSPLASGTTVVTGTTSTSNAPLVLGATAGTTAPAPAGTPNKRGLLASLFSSSKKTPPPSVTPDAGQKNTPRPEPGHSDDTQSETPADKRTLSKSTILSNVGEPIPIINPARTSEETPRDGLRRPEFVPSQPNRTPVFDHTSIVNPAHMGTSVEWVGEPTPLVKTPRPAWKSEPRTGLKLQPEPESRHEPKRTPLSFSRPAPAEYPTQLEEDLVEWVGEPMPILKSRTSEPDPERTETRLPELMLENTPDVKPEMTAERLPESMMEKTESLLEMPMPPVSARRATPEPLMLSGLNLDGSQPEDTIFTLTDKITPKAATHSLQDSTPETKTAVPLSDQSPNLVSDRLPDLFGFDEQEKNDMTLRIDESQALYNDEPVAIPDPQHIEYVKDAEDPANDTEDVLLADSDATIRQLLQDLDAALEQAIQGQEANDMDAVRNAAMIMTRLAVDFDLRILDDPAQCMELAARAGDTDEIAQLMPDLVSAIARNRAAFIAQ